MIKGTTIFLPTPKAETETNARCAEEANGSNALSATAEETTDAKTATGMASWNAALAAMPEKWTVLSVTGLEKMVKAMSAKNAKEAAFIPAKSATESLQSAARATEKEG